ncbi:uncharacterized protein TA05410 [Theileria annulata]|uniref:Uncharacterized protein n=1 Tax=Theileria annulata TaxID=5874 RepID=Q4UCS2_THEAN|nr:uncharacterized protein TA05410 [Theileria annulata]CAI75379.1 hypothetical protein, conserved [Theileria annulata]|eukprot:XP_954855.1 hypothetical protein, conserved [Theileria annulata]
MGDDLDYWESYKDSDDDVNASENDNNLDELSDRLKSQKLSEDSDLHFTNDLFAGYSKVKEESSDNLFSSNLKQIGNFQRFIYTYLALADPYSQIELKCLKDCETLSKKLSQKIETSPAKSAVWLQFLDILLQSCEKKMELKDLQTLKRKVENFIKNKENAHRDKSLNKKKPNDVGTSKNYQDELDMLYGELSDTDEVSFFMVQN